MNKASELFSSVPRRHNCAQAVACGCGGADLYEELSSCGVGRAPGGLCGALYAAKLLSPANADKIEREFISGLGASDCQSLKRELGVPCSKCVEFAAELLEKYSADGPGGR